MFLYIIRKYLKGTILALLLFGLGYSTDHTFDSGMTLMVCLGMFVWFGRLIYLMQSGNAKKGVALMANLIHILRLIWYVASLKPLRILIRRMRYGTFTATPYPYLALYGSIVDTHAMKGKFGYGIVRSKSPVTRAAVWRLLTHGSLRFAKGSDGQLSLKLGPWKEVSRAGLDQELERTVYRFMERAAQSDGTLAPKDVKNTIVEYTKIKKKGGSHNPEILDNQFQFADLLNTSISLKAYTKEEVRKIFGMKRFLKRLPSSYEEALFDKGKLEILRIWPEYMTYAYLFGIEHSTLERLSRLLPSDQNQWSALQYLMTTSAPHRQVVDKMMKAVSEAAPEVEDTVAGKMGRFTFAWHVNEIYDI